MKRILKFIIIILFTMILSITINNESKASSSNDLYLEELSFKALIEKDGDLFIEETWDIDIKNTNTLFKTFETDTSKYSGITDVKVTDITRGNKPLKEIGTLMNHVTKDCYYGLRNDDGDFEIAWGVGMDNTVGHRTYAIQYTVKDVIKQYEDYSELYWQFIGKDFAVDAQKIRGEIHTEIELPTPQDIKVWGHTEDLNGTINTTDHNIIAFELNNFRNGRFVEVRTLIPNNLVGNVTRKESGKILPTVLKEEEKWAKEANLKRTMNNIIPTIITIISLAIGVAIIIWLIKLIINSCKNISKSKPLKPSQEIIYYRDLPNENATPLEALYVYEKKKSEIGSNDLGKVFSATIMDLVLKGKLTFVLNNTGKKDVTIKISNKAELLKDLPLDEKKFAEIVLETAEEHRKDEVTLQELQKHIKEMSVTELQTMPNSLHTKLLDKLSDRGIFNKDNLNVFNKIKSRIVLNIFIVMLYFILGFGVAKCPKEIALISGIAIVILSIINIVLAQIASKRVAVYTQEGIDESTKWKGLKKYMEEFSLLKEKEVPEIVLWEKFLVYATVFGIADKVLKQLKVVYPDLEEITSAGSYAYMHVMLSTNFTKSFSNAISTSMSSAYSSASGSGGGFSGGGGGGRRTAEVEEEDNLL